MLMRDKIAATHLWFALLIEINPLYAVALLSQTHRFTFTGRKYT